LYFSQLQQIFQYFRIIELVIFASSFCNLLKFPCAERGMHCLRPLQFYHRSVMSQNLRNKVKQIYCTR